MAATSARMVDVSREMTAERGLSGFTIEDVCEQVGVSRRTFFNYFASKENAVLGLPARVDGSEQEEVFLNGSTTKSGELSPNLVTDLGALILARWHQLNLQPSDIPMLKAAFEREPRLATHLLQQAAENSKIDIALLERREGLVPGDIRAKAAVHLIGSVLQMTTEQFFQSPKTTSFEVIFEQHLSAVRDVFAA